MGQLLPWASPLCPLTPLQPEPQTDCWTCSSWVLESGLGEDPRLPAPSSCNSVICQRPPASPAWPSVELRIRLLHSGQLAVGDGVPEGLSGVLASQALLKKILDEDSWWQGDPLAAVGRQPGRVKPGLTEVPLPEPCPSSSRAGFCGWAHSPAAPGALAM